MKTVDIIYRYEARDTSTRPLPSDSNAALLRLNDDNRDFAHQRCQCFTAPASTAAPSSGPLLPPWPLAPTD